MNKNKITSIELEGLYVEVFKTEMRRLVGTGNFVSTGKLEQLENDLYKSLRVSRKKTLFRLKHPFLWRIFGNKFYDIPDILEYIKDLKSDKKLPDTPPKTQSQPTQDDIQPSKVITADLMRIDDTKQITAFISNTIKQLALCRSKYPELTDELLEQQEDNAQP